MARYCRGGLPVPALKTATPAIDSASPDAVSQHALVSSADKSRFNPENTQYAGNSATTITKSGAWDKIDFNSRRLTNNQWGAPADESLTSSVYLSQNERLGWYWCRQDPQKTGLVTKPIYPNIRIGGSPWEPSSSAYFPIKLSDAESLEFDTAYTYLENTTGSFNLSYDMFLSDTNQAGREPKINAEVMIWLHGTKKQLPVTYKGDFTDGYNSYELYSWKMLDGRQYYSFIMKGEPQHQAKHGVNARALIDKLGLDSNWYIHGVELGTEVWDGSGKIEIEKFTVSLNGKDL